ncbi:MAG TPA: hypothetical protein VMF11_06750 [Candidatus Baltobacteraceae bacterium]|nr:hypothetical protein [Candidatus Baltobacteraceae bacterium]
MKRLALSCSVVAAAFLLAVQPAFAARIYNFLPVPVFVRAPGLSIQTLNLAPGERSGSLSWTKSYGVQVQSTTVARMLCNINYGLMRADMQGGNYMTIGHQGNQVICTVCNSSHNQIHRGSGTAPADLWDAKRYPSSRTGC